MNNGFQNIKSKFQYRIMHKIKRKFNIFIFVFPILTILRSAYKKLNEADKSEIDYVAGAENAKQERTVNSIVDGAFSSGLKFFLEFLFFHFYKTNTISTSIVKIEIIVESGSSLVFVEGTVLTKD